MGLARILLRGSRIRLSYRGGILCNHGRLNWLAGLRGIFHGHRSAAAHEDDRNQAQDDGRHDYDHRRRHGSVPPSSRMMRPDVNRRLDGGMIRYSRLSGGRCNSWTCSLRPGCAWRGSGRWRWNRLRDSHRRRNWRRERRWTGGSCLSLQALVVLLLASRVQQAELGRRDFVEDLLRERRVLARLERADMRHAGVGRVGDDVRIRLKQFQSEQAVMVWRLFVGANPEPLVIAVEIIHCSPRLRHPEAWKCINQSSCIWEYRASDHAVSAQVYEFSPLDTAGSIRTEPWPRSWPRYSYTANRRPEFQRRHPAA